MNSASSTPTALPSTQPLHSAKRPGDGDYASAGPHSCHMDRAPGIQSPRITGHNLMSLFPAPSPLTSQMQSETRCRVFERQERAFFAAGGIGVDLPLALDAKRVSRKREHSRQRPSVKRHSGAQTTNGHGATRTAEDPSTRVKADQNTSSVRRTSRRSAVSDIPSPVGTWVFGDASMRSARSTSRRVPSRSQKPAAPASEKNGSMPMIVTEVAAIEARRVDRETGVTWVEVEYRPWDPEVGHRYAFQNIVVSSQT
ncbi:hypothetical protein BC835DRAFT_1325253 [Cytidiella melzeri]|nr:hypothetical protein BC835DRAFT_1325253 [Cytidiella melzeri]